MLHDLHAPTQAAIATHTELGAIEHDTACTRDFDAEHELGERRLARARFTDDGNALPRGHSKVNTGERAHHALADCVVFCQSLDLKDCVRHAHPRVRSFAQQRCPHAGRTIIFAADTGNYWIAAYGVNTRKR